MRHRFALVCALLTASILCACARGTNSTTVAEASASTASMVPSPSLSATGASPSSSAGASPAPTIDPNLLASSNGTIVRSFPANQIPTLAGGLTQPSSPQSVNIAPASRVFVFELPGVAQINQFAIHPDEGLPDAGGSVSLAVATTGMQDAAFTGVGNVTLKPGTPDPTLLPVNVNARWVRLTIQSLSTADPDSKIVASLEAFGSLAPHPGNAPLDGYFREIVSPYNSDSQQFDTTIAPDAQTFAFTQTGASANAEACEASSGYAIHETNPGSWDGRAYSLPSEGRRWVSNDDGSMLVGVDQGNPIYLVRATDVPPLCASVQVGSGAHDVFVIDSPAREDLYPLSLNNSVSLPPYRFIRIQASQLNQRLLASTDTVVWNMLCDGGHSLDSGQMAELLAWVSQGNKLVMHDADRCDGSTVYDTLPYPFITENPGAKGAPAKHFIVLENDPLGSTDSADRAHFVDTAAYLADGELGDANVVVTKDTHWCGHLFGTNVDNVSGFIQMYGRYGRGMIVYDGLDHDDFDKAPYQRIVKLELDLPVGGDFPCTRPASALLVLVPDQELKFVAGKAQTLHAALQLYGSQGWAGPVTIVSSGQLHASVIPSSFDLAAGGKPLQVAIQIPATALPGTYPILVSANAPDSPPAQATLTVAATSSIAGALATQKRVRIYGIHFDYNSARIQPESEPVVAQIAGVMRANPKLRLRVEGYTDSDGGYSYNMGLSQRRAQSVVNDLVTHYGIARSRLTPKGFGLTDPVASNATPSGKALNRRVELVRI
jgi:outer membrane protein OmpA-like peptidoglycan-associated protein